MTDENKSISLAEVFDDITARFFANLPRSEINSSERMFVQLTEAHWFFQDFFSDRYAELPHLNFRQFCEKFFQLQPLFAAQGKYIMANFTEMLTRFRDYIAAVPVCGCIVLSPDMQQTLLVKSWQGKNWGFPKGKLDKGENEVSCAIREMDEEVGLDVSKLIVAKHFVEVDAGGRRMRLFIVRGVDPRTAQLKTKTRKEIGAIEWVDVASLPRSKAKAEGKGGRKFWMVQPFIPRLLRFIAAWQSGEKLPRPIVKPRPENNPYLGAAGGGGAGGRGGGKQQQQQQQRGSKTPRTPKFDPSAPTVSADLSLSADQLDFLTSFASMQNLKDAGSAAAAGAGAGGGGGKGGGKGKKGAAGGSPPMQPMSPKGGRNKQQQQQQQHQRGQSAGGGRGGGRGGGGGGLRNAHSRSDGGGGTDYDGYSLDASNEYRDRRTQADWDTKLAETFGKGTGWTPEEMFRVNAEKFGVKSTAPKEELVYPLNADELFRYYLGNKKGPPPKPIHAPGTPAALAAAAATRDDVKQPPPQQGGKKKGGKSKGEKQQTLQHGQVKILGRPGQPVAVKVGGGGGAAAVDSPSAALRSLLGVRASSGVAAAAAAAAAGSSGGGEEGQPSAGEAAGLDSLTAMLRQSLGLTTGAAPAPVAAAATAAPAKKPASAPAASAAAAPAAGPQQLQLASLFAAAASGSALPPMPVKSLLDDDGGQVEGRPSPAAAKRSTPAAAAASKPAAPAAAVKSNLAGAAARPVALAAAAAPAPATLPAKSSSLTDFAFGSSSSSFHFGGAGAFDGTSGGEQHSVFGLASAAAAGGGSTQQLQQQPAFVFGQSSPTSTFAGVSGSGGGAWAWGAAAKPG